MRHILFPRKNMLENRLENSIFPRVFALLAGWGSGVLLVLLLVSAAPVSAQASVQPTPPPFVTPTPLPAVQAAQQAAAQSQSAAQTSQQQAAQLRAQAQQDYAARLALADEIQHNADAQAAQAAQAYSDARAAAAAQNGAAVGEAIGRGEGAVTQLRESLAGMSQIVATLSAQHDQDQKAIDNLTQIAQQATTDKQTILNSYTSLKAQNEKDAAQAETDNTLSYIVKGFLFIVFAVLLIALIMFVIGRRRDAQPHDDNHSDAIPGEFTRTESEASNDPTSSDSEVT